MSVSNHVQYMSTSAHGHQSNYQGQTAVLRHEDDIEKRIQARIAKDGIRIKEFFIDFDKLRKGTVGEAAVSTSLAKLFKIDPVLVALISIPNNLPPCLISVPHMHWHSWSEPDRSRDRRVDQQIPQSKPARTYQLP